MGVCCNSNFPRVSAYLNYTIKLEHNKLTDNYEVLSTISIHSNSLVLKGKQKRKKKNNEVAIKSLIKKKFVNPERLTREFEILAQLSHPNIVKFIEVIEDHKYIHIITEYCNGGDLQESIKASGCFSEEEAAQWLFTACNILLYLHAKDICHRDVKLDNFLIHKEGNRLCYKLTDFGLSSTYADASMHSAVGTVLYAPPEIFTGSYSKQCDVWSLGVSLYVLLCGNYPFPAVTQIEVISKIMANALEFKGKIWERISANAKELLSKMIRKNYVERITLTEILNSPWLRESVFARDSSFTDTKLNKKTGPEDSCITVGELA